MSRDRLEVLQRIKRALLGDKAKTELNLDIILDNPTSIPEHTNYYEEVDSLIGSLAEINDKLSEVDAMLNLLKQNK
tara:strand:- start:2773 stop:3000 length:228 start_codon:yes stop_codon:yes gene_type:complete